MRGGAFLSMKVRDCIRVSLLAMAVALIAAPVLPAAADAVETWYETQLGGLRIGAVGRTAMSEGDSLLVTVARTDVVVERFGERAEMSQEDVWTETTAGRPVSYVSTRALAQGEVTTLVVEVSPDVLSVDKKTGRGGDRHILPLETALLFPRAIERLHADRGFVAGDAYAYVTFDSDFEAVSRCSVAVVGPDTLHVAGHSVELNLLHVFPDVYEGLIIKEWRDAGGELWVQEIPGLGVATRRTEGRVGLKGHALTDVASGTIVEVGMSIPHPDRVDAALYEIWTDDGDVEELLTGDLRQTVEGHTDRGVLLRVRRTVPGDGRRSAGESDSPMESDGGSEDVDEPAPADVPGEDGGLEQYLEGNVLIQKDDPDVRAAALEAVDGAGDEPWSKAVSIERRVSELITDRGYGTAFASAAEVIDTRSGDCSEHALLAAAMARAVGIPSRLATGLVHFQDCFAYHMWTEVKIGAEWYALDPTQGGGSVDATHIRLGGSSLSGGRIGSLSIPVLRTVGRLGLRIVEYEEAGETHSSE
jgi:hypothetical protein